MTTSNSSARTALGAAATITAAIAVWLLFVTTAILPARDPASIPLWRGVAAGFLAYSTLSLWIVAHAPHARLLGLALLLASVVACGVGLCGLVATLGSASAHFEGYLVLMAMLLCAHGAAGIAYERGAGRGELAR
jgi:hypothetical protein